MHETAAINLNSAPPVDKSALEYGLTSLIVFLAVVFFLAFTGRKTPWKNRTAIIFSYLVIAIFLAVPILAPVMLLRMFPSAVDAMIGMPAGLINTHTSNQPDNETQWALNIGGYSFRVPAKSAGGSANQTAGDATASTGSTVPQGELKAARVLHQEWPARPPRRTRPRSLVRSRPRPRALPAPCLLRF